EIGGANEVRRANRLPRAGEVLVSRVAEELLTVATEKTLLVECGPEDAERPRRILPTPEGRELRRPLVGEIVVIALSGGREAPRWKVQRSTSDDIYCTADATFRDVGLARLVHFEPADDFGWQQAEIEAP